MMTLHAQILEGITDATRQRILDCASQESYAPGEFLFRLGDPVLHFFILTEGRVRLSLGREERLAYVDSHPGDLIGWSTLVENERYMGSAQCLVPVKALRIEKHRVEEILLQDPASGMIFFKNLAALIGRRLVKSYQAVLSVQGERESQPGG
jgi:CRP/FNR family cyclic AMP-dependent transcriptional regulator